MGISRRDLVSKEKGTSTCNTTGHEDDMEPIEAKVKHDAEAHFHNKHTKAKITARDLAHVD